MLEARFHLVPLLIAPREKERERDFNYRAYNRVRRLLWNGIKTFSCERPEARTTFYTIAFIEYKLSFYLQEEHVISILH